MNLPQNFVDKMNALLGQHSQAFFDSLDNPSQKGITLNTSRMDKETFEQNFNEEIEKIELTSNGYYVNSFKFGENLFNHAGIIYSQEPSAMYPVELLDIKSGDKVLDVCASPGGKSIQILEKLNGSGLLVSNEIVFKRAKILEENISKMGFDNVIITCNSPEDLENTNFLFDKIIIDAPCGGEGMIRKSNFDIVNYNSEAIETNAIRQLKILESIKHLLKDNGTLVYSTCTYDIRENEGVIAKFLTNNPEFEILNKKQFLAVCEKGIKVDNFDTDLALRRYPHTCRGEGQFMIALTRKDNVSTSNLLKQTYLKGYSPLNSKELTIVNNTLKSITDAHFDFIKRGDNIFTLPTEKIDLSNLNAIYVGCYVGQIQKGLLKLTHEFYHTYGKLFKNKIELDSNQASKYIHGEEIDTDLPNGIYAVNYLHTTLGGGKISNGKLKNYYKKELRI